MRLCANEDCANYVRPRARWCEECMRERRRALHRRYESRRPPRGEQYRAKQNAYRACNPEKHLLWQARYRAKTEFLEFNLELSDIVIPVLCPYFGVVLAPAAGKGGPRYNSPSLDRIDNAKGYVKGNVEVISYRANALKRDLSLAEMELVGAALAKRAKEHA